MNDIHAAFKTVAIGIAAALLASASCIAAEVKVMNSGGFSAAYKALAPEFEKATGHTLSTAWGPSMGETPQAIPNRIDRGEPVDVVIVVGEALDGLLQRGKVVAGSRVDLARSKIAMAVKQGAAKPDISTMESFKRTVLNAKSIAYSDSASGVYLEKVLFPRMGISQDLKGKARMIPAEPVGLVVGRGEAEIGFQQVSELIPQPGIEIVGLIPAEAQKVTVFAAGISATSQHPEAAKALIDFLASRTAADAVAKTGMEPVASVR
jgi:molybdate transport system substrate-binding protein